MTPMNSGIRTKRPVGLCVELVEDHAAGIVAVLAVGFGAQNLNKAVTTLAEWSSKHEWVKRVAAWDAEQDRIARAEMAAEMAATRKKQRKQAQRMQEKGMELLESIRLGDAKLSEIVSLLKAGMEQERIADVGEFVEERSGEAVPPVQIYIPDNNRGKDKDTFDDLEVE